MDSNPNRGMKAQNMERERGNRMEKRRKKRADVPEASGDLRQDRKEVVKFPTRVGKGKEKDPCSWGIPNGREDGNHLGTSPRIEAVKWFCNSEAEMTFATC